MKCGLFQCTQLAPEIKTSSKISFFPCPNKQVTLFECQNPHSYLIFDARVLFVNWAKVSTRAKVSPVDGTFFCVNFYCYLLNFFSYWNLLKAPLLILIKRSWSFGNFYYPHCQPWFLHKFKNKDKKITFPPVFGSPLIKAIMGVGGVGVHPSFLIFMDLERPVKAERCRKKGPQIKNPK